MAGRTSDILHGRAPGGMRSAHGPDLCRHIFCGLTSLLLASWAMSPAAAAPASPLAAHPRAHVGAGAGAGTRPPEAATGQGRCTRVTSLVVVAASETLTCLTVGAGGDLEIYNGGGCGSAYPVITLTLTDGGTVEEGGRIGMYSSNSCDEGGDSAIDIARGVLVNDGTLLASWRGPGPRTPSGGHRLISGDVTNRGTVVVSDTLYLGAPSRWDNEGSFDIQATGPGTCEAWAEAQATGVVFDNGPGGRIVSTGRTGCAGQTTGILRLDGGDTFVEAGPVRSGRGVAVLVEGGTLHYTGPGRGSVEVQGTSNLVGRLAKGQALQLDGASGFCQEPPAVVTVAPGFVNAGTITWGCNDGQVAIVVPAGTLTNTGTIDGPSSVSGNVRNLGTVAVADNQALTYQKGTFTNDGLVLVSGSHATFTAPAGAGATFLNEPSGRLDNTGAFTMASGDRLSEAGRMAGVPPLVVGGSLSYTGHLKSTVEVQGDTTVSGTMAKGQTLLLYGASGFCQAPGANVTALGGFSSEGTITGVCGGGPATITVPSGTFTNTGALVASPTSIDVVGRVDNGGVLESGPNATLKLGSLVNYAGGTLRGGTYVSAPGSGGLSVAGLDVRVLDATVTLDGAGLSDGTADALKDLSDNQGNLTLGQSGTTETVAGPLTNSGRLTLGPGVKLVVPGTYRQVPAGALTSVAGAPGSYGQLAAAGRAALSGTLSFSSGPGFKAVPGTVEQVVTYASRTGRFAAVSGTALAGGLHLVLSYQPTAAELVVRR